jgi:uncharacterized GH25 family protein
MRIFLTLLTVAWCVSSAIAHDTWVETNTNVIRTGDAVHVDLKLGNHGNEHRDFKLASKTTLATCTLSVTGPDGSVHDLKPQLADVGYAPNEGYWSGKYVAVQPGLYVVAQTRDGVVNHGRPLRSIKSGKTMFVASPTLDRVPRDNPGFDRPLGHPFEFVPVANPATPMGPGQEIAVRLLLKGQPIAGTRVSFIPRGETLHEGVDDRYERTTDADGVARFTPKTGNVYLVVAHHLSEEERGADYEATTYSATLTVFVPELCPCCGE